MCGVTIAIANTRLLFQLQLFRKTQTHTHQAISGGALHSIVIVIFALVKCARPQFTAFSTHTKFTECHSIEPFAIIHYMAVLWPGIGQKKKRRKNISAKRGKPNGNSERTDFGNHMHFAVSLEEHLQPSAMPSILHILQVRKMHHDWHFFILFIILPFVSFSSVVVHYALLTSRLAGAEWAE